MIPSSASLICTHLNAPYGDVVSIDDLILSFCHGRLSGATEQSNAILSQLFLEIDPSLVGRCAYDLGLSLDAANQLYVDTMRSGAPRCPAWERSVGHMVDMVDMVQA